MIILLTIPVASEEFCLAMLPFNHLKQRPRIDDV